MSARKAEKPSGGASSRKGGPSRKGRLFFWFSAGVIVLLLGSAWLGQDGYLAVLANRERAAALRREIVRLEADNQELRAEIRSLRSDMRMIERIAREDLGLVKKGETVYEFLPPEK